MDDQTKRKKVLCPVTHGEKTVWLRMGSGFLNKDSSINIYLDCLPVNGKLQIRDWDDAFEKRNGAGGGAGGGGGGADAPRPLSLALGDRANDVPF